MADNETQLGGVRVDGEGHTIRADHIDARIHAETGAGKSSLLKAGIAKFFGQLATWLEENHQYNIFGQPLEASLAALRAGENPWANGE